MGNKVRKGEGILRLISMVLSTMTALLVGLDTQTKTVFFIEKKATVKDLQPLWIATIVASVVAGYQLIQLCRCLASTWLSETTQACKCTLLLAWVSLLFDQGTTYMMFASTVAATQASMIAVTGVKPFQWTKLCNIYTRFCFQMGGGFFCGIITSVSMAFVAFISANHLFKLYPSYHRLCFSCTSKPACNST
ncbi:putative casparian strip membrane protein [Dioscorea sansibarensis]